MKSTSHVKRTVACIVVVMALLAGTRILAFVNAGMWYSSTATTTSNGSDPDLSRCLPNEIKFSDYEEAQTYARSIEHFEVGVYSDPSGGYIVAMTKPNSECGWLDNFRANEINWGYGFIGSGSSLLFLLLLVHFARFNRPGIYDGWMRLPESSSAENRKIRAVNRTIQRTNAEIKLQEERLRLEDLAKRAAIAHIERLTAESQVRDLNDGVWPTLQRGPDTSKDRA